MISIKKYLDLETLKPAAGESAPDQLDPETTDCFCSVLSCVGTNAIRIAPGLGVDLETNLLGLGNRLADTPTAKSLKQTQTQAEVLIGEWGERTADHFKEKTNEVKELLISLAKAAECVSSKDRSHSGNFKELIGRMERIAGLDDITEMRSSIVKRVTELKNGVNQMTRESQQLVAQLKAEVSTYETRLRSVEQLAYRDELTLVANRRGVEERMRHNIAISRPFCVVMLDLNHFKGVNDRYGHVAGDDLLKQFAKELQLNTRSGDLAGRWGGDEFILVLQCDEFAAKAQIERIQGWVFGKYKIQVGSEKKTVEVRLDASIGCADWHPGETIEEVVENAARAMYLEKSHARMRTA